MSHLHIQNHTKSDRVHRSPHQGERDRDRERDRQRDRERQREIQTERETERQRDRERQRETERQRDRERQTERDRQREGGTDMLTFSFLIQSGISVHWTSLPIFRVGLPFSVKPFLETPS